MRGRQSVPYTPAQIRTSTFPFSRLPCEGGLTAGVAGSSMSCTSAEEMVSVWCGCRIGLRLPPCLLACVRACLPALDAFA